MPPIGQSFRPRTSPNAFRCRRRAEHRRLGLRRRRKHIPTRDNTVGSVGEIRKLGQPAGCDDHNIGCKPSHIVGLNQRVVVHRYPEPVEFGNSPFDDSKEILSFVGCARPVGFVRRLTASLRTVLPDGHAHPQHEPPQGRPARRRRPRPSRLFAPGQ